jgi:hypothetical protein
MINIILTIIASLLLLLGIVSMVTPIPGGTIMIAGSLTSLVCTSPKAQFCVRYLRTKFKWFNKLISMLESKVGAKIKVIGHALKNTRPYSDGISPIQ